MIPVFSFDYLTVERENAQERRGEDEAPTGYEILVAKGRTNKIVFAHTVAEKGVSEDQYAVEALVEDLKWLGCNHMTLKLRN